MKVLKRPFRMIISMIVILSLLGWSCVWATSENAVFQKQFDSLFQRMNGRISREDFQKLEEIYRENSILAEQAGKLMLTSFDFFIDEYDGNDIDSYIDNYHFETESYSRSGSSSWYYNTGTSLPQAAAYFLTNMLSVVSYGDIVVEEDSVTQGILGHAAIVEGIFYNSTYHVYYIRLVEAILDGVCRSVIDDDRYFDKQSAFYRVSSASSTTKSSAINFAKSQFGKPYVLYLGHSASSNNSSWYCSELVWASYYNAGIDFFPYLLNTEVISPYYLAMSAYTSQVTITEY